MSIEFDTGLPASGTLVLQCCGECHRVSYPPRELCGHCLADALAWSPVDDTGTVQSLTELHYSLEPSYARHLPWVVASVRLDCGPVVLAHLPPGIAVKTRVKLRIVADAAGNRMLLAAGTDDAARQAASAWLASVEFREIPA